MAGNGSRFSSCGYKLPKPFIDVNGIPMIEAVINNLKISNAKYYLITRIDHYEANLDIVKSIKNNYNVEFITINKLTEGAACTALYSRKYINNQNPLVFANSDQIVDINVNDFIENAILRDLDGSILTFEDNNPKWSFVEIDNDGFITRVAEKNPISNIATVGIYYFKHGSIFVNATLDMIIQNDRFNNEFYLCPSYNYAIKDGLKVGVFNIDKTKMHGIGTPEDLEIFLKL